MNQRAPRPARRRPLSLAAVCLLLLVAAALALPAGRALAGTSANSATIAPADVLAADAVMATDITPVAATGTVTPPPPPPPTTTVPPPPPTTTVPPPPPTTTVPPVTTTGGGGLPPTGSTTVPGPKPLSPLAQQKLAANAARRAANANAAAQRLAARNAAKAARIAAQDAHANLIAHQIWQRVGQPNMLIIVGKVKIDLVAQGSLSKRIPVPVGQQLSLRWLVNAASAPWVSNPVSGTTMLSAELVLTAGSSFAIDNGTPTVQLAGGANPADAASILIGRTASLTISHTSIDSIDPATNRPVAANAPGRPFIVAQAGGQLNIADATVSDLGVPGRTDHVGVTWAGGSTGSATRSSFLRNGVGVKVTKASNVGLNQITIDHSISDGLVLNADQGTVVQGVTSANNGGDGIGIYGNGSGRRFGAITVSGNQRFGVAAAGQQGLALGGLTVSSDHVGGIRLTRCVGTIITALTSNDEPIGVAISGASQQTQLIGAVVHRGGVGVAVRKGVSGVQINQLTADGSGAFGVRVDAASQVVLRDSAVSIGGTALWIGGASQDVTVTGGTLAGGQFGIAVAAPASQVSLTGVTAGGTHRAGIAISASGVRLAQVTVNNSQDGLHIYRQATGIDAQDVTITGGGNGVVASAATSDIRLSNLIVQGVSNDAVATSSPGLIISGGRLSGGNTGVNARAPMTLTALTINQVTEGIHVQQKVHATGTDINVLAEKTGIKADPAADFVLTNSSVHAPVSLKGNIILQGINDIGLPPVPWLAVVGLCAVCAAILLQFVHRVRQRKHMRSMAPAHVLNTA
jgi:hypothetical protein